MQVTLTALERRLREPIIYSGKKHGFAYIVTPSTEWLAKPVHDFKRALWWERTDAWIRERGFTAMPGFFVWQNNWAVMRYIQGRTAQYRSLWDLQQAVRLLAQFHTAANRVQHTPISHRGSTLPERLIYRHEQYRCLHEQLSYDYPQFLPISNEYLRLGEKALNRLDDTALMDLTQSDMARGSVAHRDLASHNIVINRQGKPWLIDFETTDFDIQLGDLWQIASRALVEWHWAPHIYDIILRTYEQIRPLNVAERFTLAHLFLYPNDFYREALGLLKRRSGFSQRKVIPYLQMMIRDRGQWYAFLRYVGVTW